MPHASDAQSSAQTDTVFVPAPGAGNVIIIDSVYVSTDTAQTVSFESSTGSLKWRQYVAVEGGHLSSYRDLFQCNVNETLTYTSSAAGNVFVAVSYRIAPLSTG